MKKILALATALFCAISLCSCGVLDRVRSKIENKTTSTEETVETTSDETTK